MEIYDTNINMADLGDTITLSNGETLKINTSLNEKTTSDTKPTQEGYPFGSG